MNDCTKHTPVISPHIKMLTPEGTEMGARIWHPVSTSSATATTAITAVSPISTSQQSIILSDTATTQSTTVTGSVSSIRSSPSAVALDQHSSSSSGLSEGAKVGIIVVTCSAAILLVLFGLVELFLRRRRDLRYMRRKEQGDKVGEEDDGLGGWRCLG